MKCKSIFSELSADFKYFELTTMYDLRAITRGAVAIGCESEAIHKTYFMMAVEALYYDIVL